MPQVLIPFVIKAIVATAISYLSQKLLSSKSRTSSIDQGLELTRKYSPDYPREIAVGRTITGGSAAFDVTSGTKNKYLYRVTIISDYQIGDVLRLWLDGDPASLSGNPKTGYATVTSHFNTELDPEEKASNQNLGPKVWVRVYDGSPGQTADAELVAASAGKLTLNSKFTGMAYMITKMEFEQSTFQGGEPSVSLEVFGAPCYDPRDVNQIKTDASTWLPTDNSALVTAQALRGWPQNGNSNNEIILGGNIDDDDVPDAELIIAADICDELTLVSEINQYPTQPITWSPYLDVEIPNLQTDQFAKRYRCGGMVRMGSNGIQESIDDLLKTMNGDLTERGGQFIIIPDSVKIPSAHYDLDEIGGQFIDLDIHGETADRKNESIFSFVDPDNSFETTTLEPYSPSAYLVEDNQIKNTLTSGLRFVTSRFQTARIQKQALDKSRNLATGSVDLPLIAMKTEVGDWITVTDRLNGLTSSVWEVEGTARVNTDEGVRVILQLSEISVTPYQWQQSEADSYAPQGLPLVYDLPVYAPPELPVINLTPVSRDNVSGVQMPSIEVTWVYDSVYENTMLLEFRRSGVSSDEPEFTTSADIKSGIFRSEFALLPGVDYDVRARAVGENISSFVTAWQTVQTPSNFTTVNTLNVGGVSSVTVLNDIAMAETLILNARDRIDMLEPTLAAHNASINEAEALLLNARNRLDTVEPTVAGNSTSITDLDTVQGNNISRITGLEGSVNDPSTGLSSKASSTELTQVETALTQSIATQASQLTAAYQADDASLDSRLLTEEQTRANADGALTTRIGSLEASVDAPSTGLLARVTSAENVEATNNQARIDALSAFQTLYRGKENQVASINPDVGFYDDAFWGLESNGAVIINANSAWKVSRVARLSGLKDLSSVSFNVEQGQWYRVRLHTYTSPDFAGWFQPLIHVPLVRWMGMLSNGAVISSDPEAISGAGFITAPETPGHQVREFEYFNPTNGSGNANKVWNFRFRSDITSGYVEFAVEIFKLEKNDEIIQAKSDIVSNTTAISNEEQARINAINSLTTNYQSADNAIDGRVTTSEGQINSLLSSVSNETLARTTAVNEIKSSFDSLHGASSQLLYNWNFDISDAEGKPAGLRAVESTNENRSQLSRNASGNMVIAGTPDNTVAYGFPAIPVDENLEYKITIRHKSSSAGNSGLYVRFNEFNNVMPTGKTHVGQNIGTWTVARTSYKDLLENGPFPGTSIEQSEYIYVPTAGVKFVSFALYQWAGGPAEYEVESVQIRQSTDALEARVSTSEAGILSLTNSVAQEGLARSTALTTLAAQLLSRADNVAPDPGFYDPTFWNMPTAGGSTYFGTNAAWRHTRAMKLRGAFDFSTDFFPIEIGETYRIVTQIYVSSDFAGYFTPLIHMPGIQWYGLQNGTSASPSATSGAGIISAPDPTVRTYEFEREASAGGSNAGRLWQYRFRGSITAGYVEISTHIYKVEKAALIETFEDALVNDDGSHARFRRQLGAGGSTAFMAMEAVDANGNQESNIAFGMDRLDMNVPADGGWKKVLEVTGDQIKANITLQAGAGIFVGPDSALWQVALRSEFFYETDGTAINFGFDIGDYDVVFSTEGLDALLSGESYSLRALSKTGTGFLPDLKITTTGTPTNITESTNATSPAGPDHMVAKANSGLASNDIYKFYASGTISVYAFNEDEFEGGNQTLSFTEYFGSIVVRLWFHNGTSWVDAGTVNVSYQQVGINPTHSSGSQNYSFSNKLIASKSWTGTIRSSASLGCFAAEENNGNGITDLNKVTYQTAGSSGTRSATPNGELAKMQVIPK